LITEQDVYSNPLFLKNKKRILSLVSERVEDEYIKTIRNSLGASPMTVSAILNNHVDLQPLRAQITVAHMLFQGILSADLEITEYGLNSTVWVPNREGTNSF
jgi:hypothetical protein